MSEVPIIGLTGGVASGKSAVADILEEQGCFVSDSDMIAHEVAQNAAVRCRSLQRGECLVGIGRSKCPPDRLVLFDVVPTAKHGNRIIGYQPDFDEVVEEAVDDADLVQQ